MTGAWTSLEDMWENRGLMLKDPCAFLVSAYLHSHKKKGTLLSDFPSYKP
jgi:hypothetical protein